MAASPPPCPPWQKLVSALRPRAITGVSCMAVLLLLTFASFVGVGIIFACLPLKSESILITDLERTQKCDLPALLNFSLPVSNTFWELVPKFVERDRFEILMMDHPDVCTSFSKHATIPGAALFGDKGSTVSGFGGIRTYGVLKVKQGTEVDLFGTRGGHEQAASGVWFADHRAFQNPSVNMTQYSDDRVALCWKYSVFVKCRMKPGALLIVGTGGSRNTTAGGCTSGAKDGIAKVQTPHPMYLQYVCHPNECASACWSYSLNTSDLWASMKGESTQVIPVPGTPRTNF
eukprot:TRINITY_DN43778_c0_g1_i1.p1 TRINITY_DN43778_c0_g1~~TRINITY_DN43778_c0_g1_i1.p1  ORF type:complete len:296 (+),score=21.40 TRINITY_DN43778_c0_g1_i1:23-889(+)